MEERLKRHYTSRYKGRFYDLAIKMYFEEGIPIKRISKELSVSRMSIYRWICILAEENVIDSMRKKSAPSSPRQLSWHKCAIVTK